MTNDPSSWLMIEPGWPVFDAKGEKIGGVDEVLGDDQTSIFHGLIVDGDEILAERIGEIRENEVHLT